MTEVIPFIVLPERFSMKHSTRKLIAQSMILEGVNSYKRLNDINKLVNKVYDILSRVDTDYKPKPGVSIGGFKYGDTNIDIITRPHSGTAAMTILNSPDPKLKALCIYYDNNGIIGEIHDKDSEFYDDVSHEMSHIVSMAKTPMSIDLDMRKESHRSHYNDTYYENPEEYNAEYMRVLRIINRDNISSFDEAKDIMKSKLFFTSYPKEVQKKLLSRLYIDMDSGDTSNGETLRIGDTRTIENQDRRDARYQRKYDNKIKQESNPRLIDPITHKIKSGSTSNPIAPITKYDFERFLETSKLEFQLPEPLIMSLYVIKDVINYKRDVTKTPEGWARRMSVDDLRDAPRLREILTFVREHYNGGHVVSHDELKSLYDIIYDWIKPYIGMMPIDKLVKKSHKYL